MTEVSESDIRGYVRDFTEHSGRASDPLTQVYAASCEVLINLLGIQWVAQHVFGKFPGASPFFRANSNEEPDQYRHQDRVVALADTLFNLQSVPGFAARLERLKYSDVESAVAELEGAKLFALSAIPVRFVDETGERGADFDLEVTMGTLLVACETKCKVETTALSEATVENVLQTARGQLPNDRPGIVFIKIPEQWAKQPEVERTLEDAVTKSLRGTGRVSAVVLHWEEWLGAHPQGAARATMFRAYHNARARTSLSEFGNIVSPSNFTPWRHIVGIVTDSIDQA
jgi:hypothetical protein